MRPIAKGENADRAMVRGGTVRDLPRPRTVRATNPALKDGLHNHDGQCGRQKAKTVGE
jgi:hypothetical protein